MFTIEMKGIYNVLSGIEKMNDKISGDVFTEVAKDMENDIEHSGSHWPTARVRQAVTSKYDKSGISIKFVTVHSKRKPVSLGRAFIRTLQSNMSKYTQKIAKAIAEVF